MAIIPNVYLHSLLIPTKKIVLPKEVLDRECLSEIETGYDRTEQENKLNTGSMEITTLSKYWDIAYKWVTDNDEDKICCVVENIFGGIVDMESVRIDLYTSIVTFTVNGWGAYAEKIIKHTELYEDPIRFGENGRLFGSDNELFFDPNLDDLEITDSFQENGRKLKIYPNDYYKTQQLTEIEGDFTIKEVVIKDNKKVYKLNEQQEPLVRTLYAELALVYLGKKEKANEYAYVYGSASATTTDLDTWKEKIREGCSFSIKVNGFRYRIYIKDETFTPGSINDVVDVIQGRLNSYDCDATITYDTDHFVITSNIAGKDGGITNTWKSNAYGHDISGESFAYADRASERLLALSSGFGTVVQADEEIYKYEIILKLDYDTILGVLNDSDIGTVLTICFEDSENAIGKTQDFHIRRIDHTPECMLIYFAEDEAMVFKDNSHVTPTMDCRIFIKRWNHYVRFKLFERWKRNIKLTEIVNKIFTEIGIPDEGQNIDLGLPENNTTRIFIDDDDFYKESESAVLDLYGSNLWIGCNNLLLLYDLEKGRFIRKSDTMNYESLQYYNFHRSKGSYYAGGQEDEWYMARDSDFPSTRRFKDMKGWKIRFIKQINDSELIVGLQLNIITTKKNISFKSYLKSGDDLATPQEFNNLFNGEMDGNWEKDKFYGLVPKFKIQVCEFGVKTDYEIEIDVYRGSDQDQDWFKETTQPKYTIDTYDEVCDAFNAEFTRCHVPVLMSYINNRFYLLYSGQDKENNGITFAWFEDYQEYIATHYNTKGYYKNFNVAGKGWLSLTSDSGAERGQSKGREDQDCQEEAYNYYTLVHFWIGNLDYPEIYYVKYWKWAMNDPINKYKLSVATWKYYYHNDTHYLLQPVYIEDDVKLKLWVWNIFGRTGRSFNNAAQCTVKAFSFNPNHSLLDQSNALDRFIVGVSKYGILDIDIATTIDQQGNNCYILFNTYLERPAMTFYSFAEATGKSKCLIFYFENNAFKYAIYDYSTGQITQKDLEYAGDKYYPCHSAVFAHYKPYSSTVLDKFYGIIGLKPEGIEGFTDLYLIEIDINLNYNFNKMIKMENAQELLYPPVNWIITEDRKYYTLILAKNSYRDEGYLQNLIHLDKFEYVVSKGDFSEKNALEILKSMAEATNCFFTINYDRSLAYFLNKFLYTKKIYINEKNIIKDDYPEYYPCKQERIDTIEMGNWRYPFIFEETTVNENILSINGEYIDNKYLAEAIGANYLEYLAAFKGELTLSYDIDLAFEVGSIFSWKNIKFRIMTLSFIFREQKMAIRAEGYTPKGDTNV